MCARQIPNAVMAAVMSDLAASLAM
jgi:hypothetical protein